MAQVALRMALLFYEPTRLMRIPRYPPATGGRHVPAPSLLASGEQGSHQMDEVANRRASGRLNRRGGRSAQVEAFQSAPLATMKVNLEAVVDSSTGAAG